MSTIGHNGWGLGVKLFKREPSYKRKRYLKIDYALNGMYAGN